jgi:hypothetical protein
MSPHKIIPTICSLFTLAAVAAVPVPEQQSASKILADTGVKGGLGAGLSRPGRLERHQGFFIDFGRGACLQRGNMV